MKKTTLLSILFMFTFFILSLIHINHEDLLNQTQVDLIYKVQTKEEAKKLANEYHLVFDQISPSGLATFITTEDTPLEELLAKGFGLNASTKITRPPWENTDDDPYLSRQYALDILDIYQAWTLTQGNSDVVVAVIDSGIDINHQEFQGQISALSYNSSTLEVGINHVIDDIGHGTMVAGVIAAIKDNGIGIAGIAPQIELMVIKANAENAESFKDSALIEGIYYAVDHGADIINLSLGSTYKNPQTQIALEYAKNHGVIVVAASGNDGTNELFYPAAFETTISVSAIESNLLHASYSNYGYTIDISAPGTDIVTTTTNNGYATVSGTSFAAPQVAGVLALMMSYYPEADDLELTQRLFLTSMDQGDEGKDDYYGFGIANAYQALTIDMFTIHFETYGGTIINPMYAIDQSFLILPENPQKPDHIFEGWYLDESFLVPWENHFLIEENITLYAKFNSEFHTITLMSQSQVIDTIIVAHNSIYQPPTLSLDDHIFIGWTLDEENLIPYDPSFIEKDTILYAHFKSIDYIYITVVNHQQTTTTYRVESGSFFTPTNEPINGYDFVGWYLDEQYSIEYQDTQPITENITIYGQDQPITLTVTLVSEGSIYQVYDVLYGESIDLPTPEKDHFTFLGWYFDDDFNHHYNDNPIIQDTTLYARFEQDYYRVTYIIDDLATHDWILGDESFYPNTPSKQGYHFIGWFLDSSFTIPYEPMLLTSDITLYGYYEIEVYTITYYDVDLVSIFHQVDVNAGETYHLIDFPQKPSSLNFDYTFYGWSEETDDVKNDLILYPIFQKAYIDQSIRLLPSIDTVDQNQTWEDFGITETDPEIEVIINNPVDTFTPGKYKVEYFIYEDDVLITTVVRMVRVIEVKESVVIELNPGLSTIYVGQTYHEAGASTNLGEIEIISNVDTSQPGVYQVIYQVNYQNITYQKVRYVHIIETDIESNPQYIKKEEDYHE